MNNKKHSKVTAEDIRKERGNKEKLIEILKDAPDEELIKAISVWGDFTTTLAQGRFSL